MQKIKFILFVLTIMHAITMQAQNESSDISLVFYIEEGSPNGTLIGTITAEDPDGDLLAHALISGNTNDAFALDPNTGDLTVNDQNELVFLTNPTYDLVVEISDGNGGDITAAVRINVTEKPLGFGDKSRRSLYPNPAHDDVYLDMLQYSQDVKLILHSLNGVVFQLKPDLSSASGYRFNVSKFKSGIYVLLVYDSGKLIGRHRLIVK